MKEYPISFLVRLQPKHKNFIKKLAKRYKESEAWAIRQAIEVMAMNEDLERKQRKQFTSVL